jgi:uncharacterized protein (UPF0276 family)
MDVRKSAACVLGAAVGAVLATPVLAADSVPGMAKVAQENAQRAQKNHLGHRYGINAVGKNASRACTVNNACMSAANHAFDATAWLDALPGVAVAEIHLAGHATRAIDDERELRIDDHGAPVADVVLRLYTHALGRFGPVPTLIEWDTRVPPLDVLVAEARCADAALAAAQERCRDLAA